MKTLKIFCPLLVFLALSFFSETAAQQINEGNPDELVVVWTSDDPYVAERVALMYTHAAKNAGWFSKVTLIIWGPSAKLTAENHIVQEKLKAMLIDGVEIKACIVCADAYGVTDKLKSLNFEVKGMGKPLTDFLKNDAKVLTF